jgi:hypothetical protein
MKKISAIILTILILSVALISCGNKNGRDNSDREILDIEIKNGYLWITYADTPDESINVGIICEENSTSEFEFFLNSDFTYSIKGLAFEDSTSINIPSTYKYHSVTKIPAHAFANSEKLIDINIPHTITSIDVAAFYNCPNFEKIIVDENNQYFKSIDGHLYNKDGTTLLLYATGKKDKSFKIPDGVTTISSEAFANCKNLEKVIIPSSVTTIQSNAFIGCDNLSSAEFESPNNWITSQDYIGKSDLSDYATAARYLTSTFVKSTWNVTAFEAVNDTVYVLYPADIYETTNNKSGVNVLATVPFGTALARSEKNSKWSKVTFTNNGATVTGYIANELITPDKKAVNFIEKKNENGTAVVAKIKTTSNLKNAIIRNFPLAYGYPNTFEIFDFDKFNENSIVAQINKGSNVTLISISEDGVWAYIKGQGKLYNGGSPSTTYTEVEGYILCSNLEFTGDKSN